MSTKTALTHDEKRIGPGPTGKLLPGAGLALYADKVTVGAMVHKSKPATITATLTGADVASLYLLNRNSVSSTALPSASAIASALGLSSPQSYVDICVDNSPSSAALTITADSSINVSTVGAVDASAVQMIRLVFTTFSAASGARVRAFAMAFTSALLSINPLFTDAIDTTFHDPPIPLRLGATDDTTYASSVIIAPGYLDGPSVNEPLNIGNNTNSLSLRGQVSIQQQIANVSPIALPSLRIAPPTIFGDDSAYPDFALKPPDYSSGTLFVQRSETARTVWIPATTEDYSFGTRLRIVLASSSLAKGASSGNTVEIAFYDASSSLIPTGTFLRPSAYDPMTTNGFGVRGCIASASNSGGAVARITQGASSSIKSGIRFTNQSTAGDFVQLEHDGLDNGWLASGCMNASGAIEFVDI